MIRIASTVATLALALGCAGGGGSDTAKVPRGLENRPPEAEWNQERVTAIAVEFSEKARALRATFHQEPTSTLGSGQAHSYYQVKQLIRRIDREAKHLSKLLLEGKGRTETLPVYANLLVIVRDAQEAARRTFASDDVWNAAGSAGDALRRLGPYYGPRLVTPGA